MLEFFNTMSVFYISVLEIPSCRSYLRDTTLVAALNKALADLKADGTYARISQKYFGADVSK